MSPTFMNTGGGDIYAAETREACIQAMCEDGVFKDYSESEVFEVPGSMKIRTENEDGFEGPVSTLEEEYVNTGEGYFLASENY